MYVLFEFVKITFVNNFCLYNKNPVILITRTRLMYRQIYMDTKSLYPRKGGFFKLWKNNKINYKPLETPTSTISSIDKKLNQLPPGVSIKGIEQYRIILEGEEIRRKQEVTRLRKNRVKPKIKRTSINNIPKRTNTLSLSITHHLFTFQRQKLSKTGQTIYQLLIRQKTYNNKIERLQIYFKSIDQFLLFLEHANGKDDKISNSLYGLVHIVSLNALQRSVRIGYRGKHITIPKTSIHIGFWEKKLIN